MGIGLSFQKELIPFLRDHPTTLDYLEVVPDIGWTDHGADASPRYVDDPEIMSFLSEFARNRPVVAHSIGLSIASAHRFRQEHVEQIRAWDERLGFAWHSDHLSFHVVLDERGEEIVLGVPFPPTLDRQTLELLVDRVQHVRSTVRKPFLLENNVTYIDYGDESFSLADFLTELCAKTGCGVLLDLHNLYVDARNKGIDPYAFINSLDLSTVAELHVAGGLSHDGFYLDAHSGAVPEQVWALAEEVVPRCPRLGGITFELLGSWFPRFGEQALLETIARMRTLWSSVQPAPAS